MEKILLEIRGGVLVNVISTSENIDVISIDYDTNDGYLDNIAQPVDIKTHEEMEDYVLNKLEEYNANLDGNDETA